MTPEQLDQCEAWEKKARALGERYDAAREEVRVLTQENDELREGLSMMSGHDRTGLDHLEEMMRASEERDDAEAQVRVLTQQNEVLRALVKALEKRPQLPTDENEQCVGQGTSQPAPDDRLQLSNDHSMATATNAGVSLPPADGQSASEAADIINATGA